MEEPKVLLLLEDNQRLLSLRGDFSLLRLLADLLRGPSLEPVPKREESGNAPEGAGKEDDNEN